jgi:hypothetical protein
MVVRRKKKKIGKENNVLEQKMAGFGTCQLISRTEKSGRTDDRFFLRRPGETETAYWPKSC